MIVILMMLEEKYYLSCRWIFKMKHILLFIFLTISVFGLTINDSLLKVHAALLPKICLMDYKFKDKLKDNTIAISILYDRNNYNSAKDFKNKIDMKYQNGIKTYKVEVKLVSYNSVDNSSANIYYLFPTNNYKIHKVISKANSLKALTFSYLEDYLEKGVMISIYMGSKVKPILNLDAVKLNDVSFRPILLKISKIYCSVDR